jgi:hypothetical protein
MSLQEAAWEDGVSHHYFFFYTDLFHVALKILRSTLFDRAKNCHVSLQSPCNRNKCLLQNKSRFYLTGAGRVQKKVMQGLYKNFVHAHMKFLAKPSVKNETPSLRRSIIEKSLKPALLNLIQNTLKTSTKPVLVTSMINMATQSRADQMTITLP